MKTSLKYFGLLAVATMAFQPLASAQERLIDDPVARAASETNVPPNALLKAYQQKKAMLFRPDAWSDQEDPDVSSWVSIGPGNVGGRIRSIVIHPTNPNTMWLGAVAGGVWKTSNGGASWSTTTDFMANLAVSCLAIDPRNPNTLYAGTGEGFFNNDAAQGYGIFKTTNGGTTWFQLPSTANSDFYWVNRLAISPASGALLAVTRSSENGPGQILRSTDGGASWLIALNAEAMDDVVFRRGTLTKSGKKNIDSPDITCLAGSFLGQVYWSANDGATWNTAFGLPQPSAYQRVELAYSRSTPSIVYASVAADGQLYRSTNGGYSFAARGAPSGGTGASWYNNCLWVDPTNPDVVIVGASNLCRTTQGGLAGSWFKFPGIHADHHALLEHPGYNGTTNKIVFDGSDGGICRTDDVLNSSIVWTSLNNNLAITQFYSGAGNVSTGKIIGGTQDNGTQQYLNDPENSNWRGIGLGGDGGFCAADQNDSNYVYGEYLGMKIFRSMDGGTSSGYVYAGITDINRCDQTGCYTNFISPFILDPNNSNTMLAGGRSLWRSNNIKTAGMPNWSIMKAPVPSNFNINAIAVEEGNSNVVWVGYNDGTIYRTLNGLAPSPTWTERDAGLPFRRTCTRLVIGAPPDPKLPTRKYACFTGFHTDNVWVTEDSGVTWASISNGLPEAPVNCMAISPTNPNRLYIGTEVGVFASPDGGITWSPGPYGQPADTRVDELFWMGTQLVAATHGRGMFTIQQQ